MDRVIIPDKLAEAFVLHALPYMVLTMQANGLEPIDQTALNFHKMLRETRGFNPCDMATWAPFLSDGSGPEITRLLYNLAHSPTTDRLAFSARQLALLILKRLKKRATVPQFQHVDLCAAIIKIGTPPFSLPADDAAALQTQYDISAEQMRAIIHGVDINEGDMAIKVSEIANRLMRLSEKI